MKKITVNMLGDYMMKVGEDVLEDVPLEEDIGLPENKLFIDFGNFLIKNYPEYKKVIKEVLQEGCGEFFDYANIEDFGKEDPATGIDLIYTAFANFCNTQNELREYMLGVIEPVVES